MAKSDFKIQEVSIEKLISYPHNLRDYKKTLPKLIQSIQIYGFRQPIVVDSSFCIVVGQARFKAAQEIGLKTVPVHIAHDLTDDQIRAYRLADNRIGEDTEWNDEALALEIMSLSDVEGCITGFDSSEIDRLSEILRQNDSDNDPDIVPEEPEFPKSKLGDIWLLDKHRLMCGDSTDAKTVDLLLNGKIPPLMVTDPPYGVNYDASWRKNIHGNHNNSNMATGKVLNDDRASWKEAYDLFKGDIAYVWHSGTFSHIFASDLMASGFDIRSQIIWVKNSLTISRGHYHPQHEPCFYCVRKYYPLHEPCFYCVKKGKTANWQGSRTETTVWNIKKEICSTGHSTQKPTECMRIPIINNSIPNDIVYDPFLCSGTTLIAAQETGRICYGIELNPAYVDVIIKRWQNFTGQKAIRECDKVHFDDIFIDVNHEIE